MSDKMRPLWEKLREGRSCIAVGLGPSLRIPDDLIAIRVNCAFPWSTGVALQQAYTQVLHWLGEDMPAFHRGEDGLRYQLLGEMPLQLQEKGFIAACHRLAEASAGQAFLLFEAVERADESVRSSLWSLCVSSRLKLPCLLVAHELPLGDVSEWLQGFRETQQGFFFWESDEHPKVLFPPFDWCQLPDRPLLVIRAGAVIGSVFEARLVAQLLSCSHFEVLESLQTCVDRGVPLGDYGDMRFFLPRHSVDELRKGVLPSLMDAWSDRLASLLSTSHEQGDARKAKRTMIASGASVNLVRESEPSDVESAGQSERKEPSEHDLLFATALSRAYADSDQDLTGMREVEFGEPSAVDMPSVVDVPTAASEPATERDMLEGLPKDHARAAAFLLSSGRLVDAQEAYLEGARHAISVGALQQGLALVQEAMSLLSSVPPSPQRDAMQARSLLEQGCLQWHGVSLEGDDQRPLRAALQTIQKAKELLPENASPSLLGAVATVFAGICCDLGELSSLDLALQELATLSRQLLLKQEPLLAARLLNDQAALYIRLGDPLRASHMLYKARELFSDLLGRQPDDESIREELAETEHLLARLPLHAPARPGREYEAYTAAIRHSYEAEELFASLRFAKEQARVWETRGRLKMALGQLSDAYGLFEQALWLQKKIGDQMGLARTWSALTDVHVAQERYEGALAALYESLLCNLALGAPLGIAFNRRAFEQIRQSAEASGLHKTMPTALVERIQQALGQGELYLGKIHLPEDPRAGVLG